VRLERGPQDGDVCLRRLLDDVVRKREPLRDEDAGDRKPEKELEDAIALGLGER